MKRVLITGGTGHFGRFLVNSLKHTQEELDIYCISQTKQPLEKGIVWLKADISKPKTLDKIKKTLTKIDVVIHLAAHVPYFGDDSLKKAQLINVQGTLNLIKPLKKGIRFIYCSTTEVYGVQKKLPIRETAIPNPISNYAKTKLLAEKKLLKSNKFELVILRFTNIYGPGEVIKRATTAFIEQALNSKQITIQSDGKEIRNYIYISDAIQAVKKAIYHKNDFKKLKNKIINIANPEELTILKIAKTIKKQASSEAKIVVESKFKQRHFSFNVKKAKSILGFKPEISFEKGIQKEIQEKRKKIFFDLDGTLIEPFNRLYKAHKITCEKNKLKHLSKKEYIAKKRENLAEKEIIGIKNNALFKKYDAERISLLEKSEYLAYDKNYKDTINCLKILKKKKISVAIVTNRKNKKELFLQLKKLRLRQYFEDIYLINKAKAKDIKKFKKGIFIGDTEEDILFGKRHSLLTIAITTGLRTEKYLTNIHPDLVVNNLSEINKILLYTTVNNLKK